MRGFLAGMACALLVAAEASANELDGLNSRAIDISTDSSGRALPGQYAAAFTSLDAEDRPNGVVIQSRHSQASPSIAIVCSTTVALPDGIRSISHPALSASGWLFVTGTSDVEPTPNSGWRLFAKPRARGVGMLGRPIATVGRLLGKTWDILKCRSPRRRTRSWWTATIPMSSPATAEERSPIAGAHTRYRPLHCHGRNG